MQFIEYSLRDVLHDFIGIPDANLSKTLPNDMSLLVFTNLHISFSSSTFIWTEQVYKILVVDLYVGSLDTEVPGPAPFFLELSTASEDSGD